MHELGLCESVLDAVERRAAGRPVSGVRLRVGVLHRVVGESMQTAFSLVSTGTVADGAAISLVHVPVQVRCLGCGVEAESEDPLAVCPRCSSTDLELSGGDDLVLESITVAAPEEEMSHVPRHPG